MTRALRIARREFIATVCTRGFLLGLVLAPIMMCGGLIGLAVSRKAVRVDDRRIAVLDYSGAVTQALIQAAASRNRTLSTNSAAGPAYLLEVIPPADRDPEARRLELSDRVRAGSIHGFVEIDAAILRATHAAGPRIRYHAKNPTLDEVRGWLGNVINEEVRRVRLQEAGLDPEVIRRLYAWVPVDGMGLAERDARTGSVKAATKQNEAIAVGVPMVVIVLAMLLIMMGSAPLLQGVMEEKTQRIAEVLLGAATPLELMLGKVLGGVAVSLSAMSLYLLAALITMGSLASLETVPFHLVPWFVAFVVSAILMYGALAAALGSACTDAKDAQQLQLPVMLPVVIPMFLLIPVLKEPQSTLATGLSLFPPFTPLLMLLRLSSPEGVPAWQPWVGLIGVVIATAAALWLGSRVFRVGILMQGKAPSLREILRWGFRG